MTPIRRVAQLEDAIELNRLVNSAYRGESSKRGWTTEADLLGGQRVDVEGLRETISHSEKTILVFEDTSHQRLIACVSLDFTSNATGGESASCYLGMLTVDPTLQASGIGKSMMSYAEEWLRLKSIKTIVISVIQLRTELIQWYERLGFQATGETKAFPYGDVRFGEPKRQDLYFRVLKKSI